MANNLHISYDLNNPGQDYDKLIEAIKSLGGWAKIHRSFWYVNSSLTAQDVVTRLWPLMDKTTRFMSSTPQTTALLGRI